MRYRILGPLEVDGDEGSVPLGSPKQRAVLGLLLLHAGEPVSTTTLIDHLWGETPPRTAEHALQTYVSALRAQLGADVIATTSRGYRVDLGTRNLDAVEFELLVAQAASARSLDDHLGANDLSRRALHLWRGPPLADVVLATASHTRMVRLTEPVESDQRAPDRAQRGQGHTRPAGPREGNEPRPARKPAHSIATT